MKKLILLLFLFTFYNSYSQVEDNKLYYFDITMDYNETKSLLDDKNKEDVVNLASEFNFKKNHIIKVIYSDKKIVDFRYINFKDSKNQKIYNNKTLTLSKSDFEKLTKTYYGRFREWTVGAYTVPFRLRSKGDDFEFDSNLSLGANLIKGVNFSKYSKSIYIDFSLGVALTKINLTESNSSIKKIDEDLKKLSESALTFSLGATVNFSKKVNFGIFYGWDFLDGQAQTKTKWIHNKKPWVGFGINVSLKNNDDSSSTQESQKDK